MNTREWALVAFTLLMQAAVGMLLATVTLGAAAVRGATDSRPGVPLPVTVAVLTGVAALIVSLLHLGQPAHAWLAITNVRTSWLSREIVLCALFVAAGLWYLVSGTRTAGWLAAALGLVAVLTMARLYMVPAQPVWNRLLTPVNFCSTALLLGFAAWLAVVGNGTPLEMPGNTLRAMAYLLVVLFAIQMVLLPAHVAALPSEPAAALTAITRTAATLLAAISAAAALAALGILVRAIQTSSLHPDALHALATPVVSMALLALAGISAIAGRVLFYAAAVELRGP